MRHHNLQVTGSVSVNGISAATAADLNTYTASADAKISTLETFTASVGTTNTFTSSASSRLDSLESFSSSIYTTNTFTSSASSRLTALETTSASVDTLNTIQNSRMDSLEAKTGSLATTGSNTFFGTQIFSGSLYIKENLIVQGSSSLQNITASAVDIGTNKIILNVDNPSVRYAGISVYDSGSTAGTGSLWWDSVDNHWLYEHPADSGAPYNSAILISGPKNAGNLGEELELVNNFIVKAVGGDHISSSAIYDDGSIVAIKNTTHITGSLNIGAITYPSVNLYTTNGTNFGITNRYTDNRLSIDKIGTGELVNILGSGNVGIGATNPTRKLDIVATGEQLRLSYSGDNSTYTDFRNDSAGGLLVNTSAGYIIHYIAGSPIMRMNANGQVGIGTTPTKLLTLRHGSADGLRIEFTGNNDNMLIDASTISAFSTSTPSTLKLNPSGGNVGIGLTSPSVPLHVLRYVGSSGTMILEGNDNVVGMPTMTLKNNNGGATSYVGMATAGGGLNFNGGMYLLSNGNVGIGITNPGYKLTVSGGSSATPAVAFTSGGSSWSEGIWINPSPNNYAGVYFLTAADTPGDGMWFTGKVSNTISGWEHAYGIFRRGYTSPIGGGTATFAIKQDGTAYFNENVINTKAYKANTFVQLSSIATKTFSWTGSPKSSFSVTDFSGVPSNAKAISVYGWYHINGYSGGAGQGDHAVCWFGLNNDTSIQTWGDPNYPWPGSNSSFAGYYHGSFVMEHDGDASNVASTNGLNYYGSWHQGIITVNSNGSIYYTLGHGYSGGTHYAALYCTGYWI